MLRHDEECGGGSYDGRVVCTSAGCVIHQALCQASARCARVCHSVQRCKGAAFATLQVQVSGGGDVGYTKVVWWPCHTADDVINNAL